MATTKEPNYTQAEIDLMIALYVNAETGEVRPDQIEEIARRLKRTVRQIRGKLVHMKLYQAQPKVKGFKDEGPTKDEMLAEMRVRGFDATGFEGATKAALARVLDLLPVTEAETEQEAFDQAA